MTLFSWTTNKQPVLTKAQIEAQSLQEAARKAAEARSVTPTLTTAPIAPAPTPTTTTLKPSAVTTPVTTTITPKDLGIIPKAPTTTSPPTGAQQLAPPAPRLPEPAPPTATTPVKPGGEDLPEKIKEPIVNEVAVTEGSKGDAIERARQRAIDEAIRLGAELGDPGPGQTGGYGAVAGTGMTGIKPVDTAKTPVTPGGDIPRDIIKPPAVGIGMTEIEPVPSDAEQLAAQQEAEQEALKQQFAAQLAQDLLTSRARSGFAGMALSGAAQGAESDIRTKGARAEALTLAETARGYRGEGREEEKIDIDRARQESAAELAQTEADLAKANAEREARAFDIALLELEKEMGSDLNGDGKIGSGTGAQTPEEVTTEATRSEVEAEAGTLTGAGSRGDPYGGLDGVSEGERSSLEAAGAVLTYKAASSVGGVVLVTDQYGNYYKFFAPFEMWLNRSEVEAWGRAQFPGGGA